MSLLDPPDRRSGVGGGGLSEDWVGGGGWGEATLFRISRENRCGCWPTNRSRWTRSRQSKSWLGLCSCTGPGMAGPPHEMMILERKKAGRDGDPRLPLYTVMWMDRQGM